MAGNGEGIAAASQLREAQPTMRPSTAQAVVEWSQMESDGGVARAGRRQDGFGTQRSATGPQAPARFTVRRRCSPCARLFSHTACRLCREHTADFYDDDEG